MTSSDLPDASPEALAHSERLVALIRSEIDAAGGSIDFARYMELALYAPGLGYYSAGAAKLGPAGDFITAAESSALYAQCLATQCRDVLGMLGGGSVLELGAGSGALAAGILEEMERSQALPERYYILDVSADLVARQRETLRQRVPRLCARVEWLDRLPAKPLRGLLVASEVVDALPVSLFRIAAAADTHSRIEALHVASTDSGFSLVARPASTELTATVEGIEASLDDRLPVGFRSECRPSLQHWITALADALESGVMLFIDYGLPRREYYLPERTDGTLLCHYRQRAHGDPFHALGLQDIGAWVDFTALAAAGAEVGLDLAGFTTQAHFLLACDLERHLRDGSERAPERAAALAREAQLLTLPGLMGERFRVLALARDCRHPLRGFALRDLTRTL